MQPNSNRRNWLKQTTLATIGLGLSLKNFANPEGITETFGMEDDLINLGSNENPHGISEFSKKAIQDFIQFSNRYSFNIRPFDSFKKDIADFHQVNENQIIITAGSTEILNKLPRYFNKGNLVTATPTFNTLPTTAKRIGTKVIEIKLTNDKVHDLQKMLESVTNDTALVYIVNPANPTGTIVTPDALKSFCTEASKKAVVVIDEAYLDLLDAPMNESMMGLIEKNENIIVVKTFSKIHAMAGLRIGYLIAHASMVKKLEEAYFNFSIISVSNLSIAAAKASLKDTAHLQTSKQKIIEARNFTQNGLKELGIQYIPSFTNFIFFPLGNYTGDYAADMLQKKIILRQVMDDGKWGRVSIGTLPEMQQFIKVMKDNWKG